MNDFIDSNLRENIIKTLVYSDLFDYPLTTLEVAKYLISQTEVEVKNVRETLRILADNEQIGADRSFFFLKGRKSIVGLREKREEWSRKKLEIAQNTANKLKVIPTINMIGITGALAMNNCKDDDDIDLLIITSVNTLWITRALIILLCPILGIQRRKRGEVKVKNKICFNLFLDEKHLKVGPESLFLAHEVCQVKTILDRGEMYERLMRENKWVEEYLPNADGKSKIKNQKSKPQIKNQRLLSQILKLTDYLFFRLQYLYMKPKMTCEKVTRYQAFFHPKNLRQVTEKKYAEKLRKVGL